MWPNPFSTKFIHYFFVDKSSTFGGLGIIMLNKLLKNPQDPEVEGLHLGKFAVMA
jgi:hypothetical protein